MFEVWFTILIISIILFALNFLIMLGFNRRGVPLILPILGILWGSFAILSILGAMAAI